MSPKLAGAFFGGVLVALGGAYLFFARGSGLAPDNFRFAAEFPLAALPDRGAAGATPDATVARAKQPAKNTSSSKRKTPSPSPPRLVVSQTPLTRPSPVSLAQPHISPFSFADPVQDSRAASVISAPSAAPVQACSFATNVASSRASIIINEVAWMGTAADANDEWIELKNIAGSSFDLRGIQLIDQGEQIRVAFDAADVLPVGGFVLLERSSDAAVPNVTAEKVYVGALGNTNEGLRLFTGRCELLDEVLANPDWPAGDNETKRTMERDASGFGWHTSSAIGGTPKAENSVPYVPPAPSPSPTPTATRSPTSGPASTPTPSPTPTPSSTPSPTPTPTPTSSLSPSPASNVGHILISEIQAAGADAGDEFIELYNPTDVAVDLVDWSVQYVSGNATSTEAAAKKNFAAGNIILAHGFFLIARAKNSSGTDGYTGAVAADLAHRSFSMSGAAAGAKVFLVNDQEMIEGFGDPNIVDVLDYSFAVPPAGQSAERKAWQGSCISAQGAGVLLGNGCDTDAADDWEVRPASEPQNTQSQVEP